MIDWIAELLEEQMQKQEEERALMLETRVLLPYGGGWELATERDIPKWNTARTAERQGTRCTGNGLADGRDTTHPGGVPVRYTTPADGMVWQGASIPPVDGEWAADGQQITATAAREMRNVDKGMRTEHGLPATSVFARGGAGADGWLNRALMLRTAVLERVPHIRREMAHPVQERGDGGLDLEGLDAAFQRDARRYDGSFVLY